MASSEPPCSAAKRRAAEARFRFADFNPRAGSPRAADSPARALTANARRSKRIPARSGRRSAHQVRPSVRVDQTMKANRAPLTARSATTRVVEPPSPREAPDPLEIDFTDPEPNSSARPSSRARLAGVKRAILRWLEKEL